MTKKAPALTMALPFEWAMANTASTTWLRRATVLRGDEESHPHCAEPPEPPLEWSEARHDRFETAPEAAGLPRFVRYKVTIRVAHKDGSVTPQGQS